MTPEELIQELRGDHAGVKPGVDRMPANLPLAMELCDAYEALRAECEAHCASIRILERERDKLIDAAEKAEAERDALRKRIARFALAPEGRDEAIDRRYLPLPGGWEIQTKGNGSTFRIANAVSGERWAVMDDYLHSVLEELARDVRANCELVSLEDGE